MNEVFLRKTAYHLQCGFFLRKNHDCYGISRDTLKFHGVKQQ